MNIYCDVLETIIPEIYPSSSENCCRRSNKRISDDEDFRINGSMFSGCEFRFSLSFIHLHQTCNDFM